MRRSAAGAMMYVVYHARVPRTTRGELFTRRSQGTGDPEMILLGILLAPVAVAPTVVDAAPDAGVPLSAAAEPRRINVLLLYTEARLLPTVIGLDEAFRSTLESHEHSATR